ncbi:hypothetical protein [uncultured Ilyobacter sp.]|jgi:Na+/H+ antiporter NhaC|uniref:hypothetical protein n=1 Tax=uncultured Ilyobacter sp. TaxID=544433 RepID=UPI002AA7EADB|nr:hypothetical protein [uncultured Ilyobacter sp.]
MTDNMFSFFIPLLIVFLIFLVIRSFWLWYWNISKRVSNQEEIIKLLSENNRLLREFLSKK